MSKDMKLIMESWNSYISLNEKKKIETLGDLKKFFKLTKVKKKGGPAAKAASKALLSFIPLAGTAIELIDQASDIKGVFSALYQKDDNFETSDALSKVNVDDEISKIVDLEFQTRFLKLRVSLFF